MDDEYKRSPFILQTLAENFESFDYDAKVGKATNIELDLHFRPNARVAKTPDYKYDQERELFLI